MTFILILAALAEAGTMSELVTPSDTNLIAETLPNIASSSSDSGPDDKTLQIPESSDGDAPATYRRSHYMRSILGCLSSGYQSEVRLNGSLSLARSVGTALQGFAVRGYDYLFFKEIVEDLNNIRCALVSTADPSNDPKSLNTSVLRLLDEVIVKWGLHISEGLASERIESLSEMSQLRAARDKMVAFVEQIGEGGDIDRAPPLWTQVRIKTLLALDRCGHLIKLILQRDPLCVLISHEGV